MKYLSNLLFTLLFLVACTSDGNTPPADVLSKDKMTMVLADIHLAESAVSSRELSRDTSIYLYRELEKQVFEKHNISKADFLRSYQWYSEHIEEYKDIYVHLVDTLNVQSSTHK